MTRRMGMWLETSTPYRTMDPDYIQSVWWSLKQIFDAGLLEEDHRVAPYCPRCGTGLSSHELAQGYETVVDPSVFVRFPLTSGPLSGADNVRASLLVWTTTPWTLVSNTATAVHPDVTYVAATNGEEALVVAEPLFESVLGEGWTITQRFQGTEMERWTYQRPFELVDIPDAHFVVVDDYVTTDDGTGLVHQAPAFGADDLRVCKRYGLPVVNPIRRDGTFEPDVPLVGGDFFKHADAALVKDLAERQVPVLFKHEGYEHDYPHCWRCHTPLIYYAQPSWYIRTTEIKDTLLRENEKTTWYPDNIKWGRYGEWLRNNVDWALSRSRYWGTPLPIWRCDNDETHVVCVASLTELSELAGEDVSELDPHRPYVDDVAFTCSEASCDGTMRREPYVIDVWYDSGSMPFAQWGYPHKPGSVEKFQATYPAQYICEALDQTRGWFYTLMAVGTLVFDRSSYENVLCLGLILAEDGRRMSKHLGNILEPIPLMDEHGADAVRWFMLASGSPWLPRRVGHATLQEVVRKVLLTYWNTASFLSLYGRTSDWTPGPLGSLNTADVSDVPDVADRPVLDRWVLSELHRLIADVDDAYENFDSQRAGALLSAFIDDLSNWYVRRSRRRFWNGDPAALATLHECVETLTRLMAPMVPFVTERVWQDLVRPVTPDAPESVHMASFPTANASLVDDVLAGEVALTRRLVELGRAARAESGVRTRQPLSRAVVGAPGWDTLREELRAEISDELNVVLLASLTDIAGASSLVDVAVKANFRSLGRRFTKDTPQVAAAIAEADAETIAATLKSAGEAVVDVPGIGAVTVTPEDVVVTETPQEGWAVAREGDTVALDLSLTDELVRAGMAREVVRMVQDARKSAGFDVADRIALAWTGGDDVATALQEHRDLVAEEVLATSVSDDLDALPDGYERTDEDLGLTVRISRATS
jgi:isoleucyl-tRNA synthetase